MKKKSIFIIITCVLFSLTIQAQTWSEWFEQKKTQRKYLLEQIAKLQVYLGYAKKGYTIVHEGLDLIGEIKRGDFNLHRLFFDRLSLVSPAIKKYAKIGDIISMQQVMLSTYKARYKQIKESGKFNINEIEYINGVFTGLFEQLTDDIVTLTTILTDGELEMQDNERLKKIDDLHTGVTNKYNDFFSFVNHVFILANQRELELRNLEKLKKLY